VQRNPREGVTVYNFRVAGTHTYFVREAGSLAEPVWVHNAGAGYGTTPPRAEAPSTIEREALDWSIVSKSGETRWNHIEEHGWNDLGKEVHGVFNDDPVITAAEAWERGQRLGIATTLDPATGAEILNVPMGRTIGWQGGYGGTGESLSSVRIVLKPGTTKIITAHPI